jgi:hypothetical protein
MVTQAGMFDDYPPDDGLGFLEYARGLAVPDLYAAIKEAEPMHFQKALASVVQASWRLASGGDFRCPEAQGNRLFGTRLFNWYMRRIHELMASHPLVTLRGYEVLQLLKPLSALFEPRIVWTVLVQELASRLQNPETETALTTDKTNAREYSGQTPGQRAA